MYEEAFKSRWLTESPIQTRDRGTHNWSLAWNSVGAPSEAKPKDRSKQKKRKGVAVGRQMRRIGPRNGPRRKSSEAGKQSRHSKRRLSAPFGVSSRSRPSGPSTGPASGSSLAESELVITPCVIGTRLRRSLFSALATRHFADKAFGASQVCTRLRAVGFVVLPVHARYELVTCYIVVQSKSSAASQYDLEGVTIVYITVLTL